MTETFGFGANWQHYLKTLDDARIEEAVASLKQLIGENTLKGKKFLDVGSGSGLFSLAARRLGAEVYSFDYDKDSVACTDLLKERYFPNDPLWQIERGSILDDSYIRNLGKFDIVYSWGVLHHTGAMNKALDNVLLPLNSKGKLCIAIYNDEGTQSKIWHKIKKTYCSGLLGRALIVGVFIPYYFLKSVVLGLLRHKNPLGYFKHYKKRRGMSAFYNWIDWIGGFPFEVAKPEEIFHRYRAEGLILVNLVTTNRLGCNQFVFFKSD